jgi:hypothetical protein
LQKQISPLPFDKASKVNKQTTHSHKSIFKEDPTIFQFIKIQATTIKGQRVQKAIGKTINNLADSF